MARKESENQKKSMGLMFRGKEIFKPLNTGRIDDHVPCLLPSERKRTECLVMRNIRNDMN